MFTSRPVIYEVPASDGKPCIVESDAYGQRTNILRRRQQPMGFFDANWWWLRSREPRSSPLLTLDTAINFHPIRSFFLSFQRVAANLLGIPKPSLIVRFVRNRLRFVIANCDVEFKIRRGN